MKKKSRFVVYAVCVTLVIGCIGALGFKLRYDFDRDIISFSKAMTKQKTVDAGGVSMGSVWYEEGGNTEEVLVHLKPGDRREGQLYLLNSKDVIAEVELKVTPLDCSHDASGECDKRLDFDPQFFKFLNLEGPKIKLRPSEIVFVDYVLHVPDDLANGMYHASLSAIDQAKTEINQGGNKLNLMAAYAIPLKVDVADEPADFKYIQLIDNPRELAKENMFISIRLYVSVLFIVLALFFVFKALRKNSK